MNEGNRLEVTREWLRFAHSDLRTARVILDHADADPRHAGFLAQQSVEKGLKGAIIFLTGAEPRRTHDLEALIGLLPMTWSIQELRQDVTRLTIWAGLGRYPDVVPNPSTQTAEGAVRLAEAAVHAVLADLRAAGFEA